MNNPTLPSLLADESTRADATTETQIVEFPAGIPGFEGCRRFVLIATDELTPLGCLRSLDAPEPSFLVIDPTMLQLGYDLTLREFERVRLGAAADDRLLWLAIVTITANSVAANLRAPIVINPKRMIGCQFIRDETDYPVDFSINLG